MNVPSISTRIGKPTDEYQRKARLLIAVAAPYTWAEVDVRVLKSKAKAAGIPIPVLRAEFEDVVSRGMLQPSSRIKHHKNPSEFVFVCTGMCAWWPGPLNVENTRPGFWEPASQARSKAATQTKCTKKKPSTDRRTSALNVVGRRNVAAA